MPTPRGRATPAMLAHLLVAKYCDHLPLYRQCDIYAREGLELDRSTLCDWVGQAAWLLDPIVAAIRAHVFAAEKIHGDDTTATGSGTRPRPHQDRAALGLCARRPTVLRRRFYSPDRGGAHPAAHMATFTGMLQADGYAGFEKLYGPSRTKPGPITEVACWAHTRRGFFDEWEHHKSPTARQALDRIAAIYAVEARAAFAPLSERVELRREAAPLLGAFFDWADATVSKLSAKSTLADAFRMLSTVARPCPGSSPTGGWRWTTTSPRTPCAASPWAGRIISLRVRTPAVTGPHPSIPSSRQQKLNSVNPETYLRDTLTRIAEGHPINRIDDLMPWKAPAPG